MNALIYLANETMYTIGQQKVSAVDAAVALETMTARLRQAKRKLEEGLLEEESHAERCRLRAQHINDVLFVLFCKR